MHLKGSAARLREDATCLRKDNQAGNLVTQTQRFVLHLAQHSDRTTTQSLSYPVEPPEEACGQLLSFVIINQSTKGHTVYEVQEA